MAEALEMEDSNIDKNTPVLEVASISKSYGKKQVLDEINLTLEAGEIFGLIGLNGVGKTTLIKTILDLTDADDGRIEVDGVVSTHVMARQHLSYLPEKFTPSKYLYGREYLSMALSYYKKPFDIDAARTMAEDLALNPDALDQKVGGYSKGMGQKLGLAGAFLVDQPFLILDEPMSGLDPKARIHLKRMLSNMREQGKTVFFSSHILSDIDEVCDRIGVIHDTKLIYCGSPADFKKEHGNGTLEESFLKAIEG